MVRGSQFNLQCPYAQFPSTSITGDLFFQPFWEAVQWPEILCFKVLAVTADGASSNKRLFKLHAYDHNEDTYGVLHKVKNPYASDERYIYFFSNPPHLLKTIRNTIANKNRLLWVSIN